MLLLLNFKSLLCSVIPELTLTLHVQCKLILVTLKCLAAPHMTVPLYQRDVRNNAQ